MTCILRIYVNQPLNTTAVPIAVDNLQTAFQIAHVSANLMDVDPDVDNYGFELWHAVQGEWYVWTDGEGRTFGERLALQRTVLDTGIAWVRSEAWA